uniref:Uncharacterized protein n=1 Tax=Crocodylus porosus TaxID=8502 RepID=A0A7M4F387_CROPO
WPITELGGHGHSKHSPGQWLSIISHHQAQLHGTVEPPATRLCSPRLCSELLHHWLFCYWADLCEAGRAAWSVPLAQSAPLASTAQWLEALQPHRAESSGGRQQKANGQATQSTALASGSPPPPVARPTVPGPIPAELMPQQNDICL